MNHSICEAMKKSALLSLFFILAGILAQVLVHLLSSLSLFSIIISYLGFFSIFIGLMIIIITVAVVMLPKVNKKLDACQH